MVVILNKHNNLAIPIQAAIIDRGYSLTGRKSPNKINKIPKKTIPKSKMFQPSLK